MFVEILNGNNEFLSTAVSFLAPVRSEWIILLCLYRMISWIFEIELRTILSAPSSLMALFRVYDFLIVLVNRYS